MSEIYRHFDDYTGETLLFSSEGEFGAWQEEQSKRINHEILISSLHGIADIYSTKHWAETLRDAARVIAHFDERIRSAPEVSK